MKIKDRIKILSIVLLTAPANILKASSINSSIDGPLGGIAPPPVDPIPGFVDSCMVVLNIALIPLALLTLFFYYLKKKKIDKKDKKALSRQGKYALVFKLLLVLFVIAVLARVVAPIIVEYYINNLY